MDTHLRSLLTTNGVDAKVIAWLAAEPQQCLTMKVFANWVDDRNELKSAVLEQVSGITSSRAQLGALKPAWREAERHRGQGPEEGVRGAQR